VTTIRLAVEDDCTAIQIIANEPRSTVSYLGGFVMMEPIKHVVKNSNMLVAEQDGEIVGFSEALPSGRHCLKMSLVAVRPELRQQRLGTSLYLGWQLIGNIQGRLHQQDHIISNNPTMPTLLPTIGFHEAVRMRSKVRRHHDLSFWYKDITTSDSGTSFSRIADGVKYKIDVLDRWHNNCQQMVVSLNGQAKEETVDRVVARAAEAMEKINHG
jgi:hypothetical protein